MIKDNLKVIDTENNIEYHSNNNDWNAVKRRVVKNKVSKES